MQPVSTATQLHAHASLKAHGCALCALRSGYEAGRLHRLFTGVTDEYLQDMRVVFCESDEVAHG
jgi:hypothetical protein